MTRIFIVLFLAIGLGSPASAFGEGTGYFEDLEYVADTLPRFGPERDLALCYTTDDVRFFGYTIFSNISGYALATDACTGEITRRLDPDDMRAAQAAGLLSADLPVVARNDIQRNILNYAVWIAIIMGLVAVIIRRVKALLGYDLRGPLRRKATQKILRALCHAGHADGIVDGAEIKLIRRTAQRLTRRAFRTAEIVKVADRTKEPLTEQDFVDLGDGLRDGEKDVMMRAVFYITLASGRLLQTEYAFLTGLAHGIGMPGEDFRRVMNDALGDLDIYPPA